jgi:drug/metabolite transporter (DMT)-like permease
MAYVFAVLAMTSIGALGLLSKLADQRGYKPLNTAVLLFGTATAIMAIDVLASEKARFVQPTNVVLAGLSFGLLAVLAFWVFLFGLKYGKITTSWVFINLSAAVPAVLSTVLYHEKLGMRKIGLLALVGISILLLWKDRMSVQPPGRETTSTGDSKFPRQTSRRG